MSRHVLSDTAAVLSRTEKQDVIALCGAGRFAEAEARADALTQRFPAEAFGWSLLGTLRLRRGEGRLAVASLTRAAALAPEVADIHTNLGLALAEADQLEQALASYDRALALSPDSVLALTNRGSALEAAGRLEEALASYDRALDLDPDHAKAHYNRGNTLKELGRLEEALDSYERAVARVPEYAFALTNRGIVQADLGRLREAQASARAALAVKADLPQALDLLASCQLRRHANPAEVMELLVRSLAAGGGLETRRLFAVCARRMSPWQFDAPLCALLAEAIETPWDRPDVLGGVAALVLEHDPRLGPCLRRAEAAWPNRVEADALFGPDGPQALAEHPLLSRLLVATPVATVALERFLTLARQLLLEAAVAADATDAPPAGLAFFSALARQCHINEYAFALTPDEMPRAETLRHDLTTALALNAPIPVLRLVAAAAYFPLAELPKARRLRERAWPPCVADLLAEQVTEPDVERTLRAKLPHLTPIQDEISRRVRQQYEENPYPRWIKAVPVDAPLAFDAFVRRRFPLAPFVPLGRTDRLDILVAGCGTGQHALETARRFRGANVLAVDLSCHSLGYAWRKAREAGVTNITFAQADILGLNDLDRRFDLIEASGVLHHLADPIAGWHSLLHVLRPGGCLRLGLYSDIARQGVVLARAFLQSRGYAPTADSMRRCRQALLDLPADDPIRSVLVTDFYSISGCRDLLFHVCEHATTLLALKAFLLENGLQLLGFDLDAATLAAYRQRFPEDPAAIDLTNWHYFEGSQPRTFLEMYQFWVQNIAT